MKSQPRLTAPVPGGGRTRTPPGPDPLTPQENCGEMTPFFRIRLA